MSIKDLFGKKSGNILSVSDTKTLGEEIESDKLFDSLKKEKERFIPEIDFSEPANFAKFGSSAKYYNDSVKLIYKTFPYDGSRNEKTQWFNSSSLLTNYIYNNLYPKNTGFINIGLQYGTAVTSSDNYTLTNNPEFIIIKGGPNTFSQTDSAKDLFGKSNYYNETKKRTSNLNLNGEDGVTVEFYLKKNNLSGSPKQVIFDLWNSSSYSSSDYGRFKIEIYPGISGSEQNIYVSLASGSFGAKDVSLSSSNIVDSYWHHYAVTAINSGTNILFQLFQDGTLVSEQVTGSTISQVNGPMIATIGSLITQNDSGSANLGYGKLSGSIDEFRYWKIKRTDKEISRFYFTEVYGGTNTDDANTDLGVYYKFNEGIYDTSQKSNYDANIIDYSGRISNGAWFGYDIGSRETGSALVESDFTEYEIPDPVLYSAHPQVISLIQELDKKTTHYDQLNNASIYNSFANWILEADQKNGEGLLDLTQIVSEFLDEFYFYIQSLPNLKDEVYREINPLPFAKRLIESRGLNSVEIFENSSVLESFLSRNEQDVFENKIHHIKNTIYQNIYNNLLYIYRSKGTEKSIRNLLRCFGIDTELLKINLYSDQQVYTFKDRFEYSAQKRKYIDFNDPDRFEGTIYQVTESGNSNSLSYIKDNPDIKYFGNTFEVETIFPTKRNKNDDFYFETNFITCSIFGVHQPRTDLDNNTWATPDSASIQIFSVRPELDSKDSYFLLSSSCFGIQLTSTLIPEIYSDQKWLLSYRIKHEKYPIVGSVSGSQTGSYIIEFAGINSELDIIKNSFIITASISQNIAEDYFSCAKKIYLGSHRQNFTGSVITGSDGTSQLCDIQIGTARFWNSYLPDSVLNLHAIDILNSGPEAFSRNLETHTLPELLGQTIPQSEALVLSWNFDFVESTDNGAGTLITGLNDAGFDVLDISSGSVEQLTRYPIISDVSRHLYPGRGDFFLRNNTQIVSYEYVPNAKRRLPEILNNDDLINILQQDDLVYTRDMVPVNHILVLEKSMYQNISEEMLRWIGTIVQFNNVIGKPSDRYEAEYRDLTFLRRLFFLNVDNTPDFEKFVDFYKWIDDSVTMIVSELLPASINTSTITSNTVESHILERNKYRHKMPTLEFKDSSPIVAVRGINELKYNWKFGHAPIPLNENTNCLWWKQRDIDNRENREQIFNVLKSSLDRKFTTIYDLNIQPLVIIDKSPKITDIVIGETKFGSGEYLEIDITELALQKDCKDDK